MGGGRLRFLWRVEGGGDDDARAPGEAGLIGKKIYVGIILLFCAVTQGFFL